MQSKKDAYIQNSTLGDEALERCWWHWRRSSVVTINNCLDETLKEAF